MSYNAYPGGHLRDMASEILAFHLGRQRRRPSGRPRRSTDADVVSVDSLAIRPGAARALQRLLELDALLSTTTWPR